MELIPPTAKKRSILQLSNFSMFVLYFTVGQRDRISIQSSLVSAFPSSELAPPIPFPQASECPLSHLDPGGDTLACGGGGGGSQCRRPARRLCAVYRIYT
jgi:hypothetical protein